MNTFDEILIGKPKLFIFQACRGGNLFDRPGDYHSRFILVYILDHLNQKEPFQFSLGKSPDSMGLLHPSTISTPPTSKTSSYSTPPPLPEEDNVRKLKQLKISSITSGGSIQLMYKKKSSTINKEKTEKIHNSASSGTLVGKGKKGGSVRSRSHSRSKYSAYFVSAASAIKSVVTRTSPCSTCKTASISTQTSLENKTGILTARIQSF